MALNDDFPQKQNPYPINAFNQLYDANIQGAYCKGFIDGSENLAKFEHDLHMETSQKFAIVCSHYRESDSSAKKKRYSEEGKLLWKSDRGDIHIPYTGVPFSVEAVYRKECFFGVEHHKPSGDNKKDAAKQIGPDHSEYDKQQKKRMILQSTFKKDCPAYFKVRKIKIYPDYKLADNNSFSNWKRTQRKREILDRLREDILKGTARSIDRFYMLAPTKDAHKNHLKDEKRIKNAENAERTRWKLEAKTAKHIAVLKPEPLSESEEEEDDSGVVDAILPTVKEELPDLDGSIPAEIKQEYSIGSLVEIKEEPVIIKTEPLNDDLWDDELPAEAPEAIKSRTNIEELVCKSHCDLDNTLEEHWIKSEHDVDKNS